MENPKTIEFVFKAIDEVNQMMPREDHLAKTPDTVLSDQSKKEGFDSLGMVNFIIALEQIIAQERQVTISLVDDLIISEEHNPFKNAAVLAENLEKILEKNSIA